MEIISLVLETLSICGASLLIVSKIRTSKKKKAFIRKKKNLIGRVVKLSPKFLSSDYKDFYKYAKIIDIYEIFIDGKGTSNIDSLLVQGIPDKKALLTAKDTYDKDYKARMKSFEKSNKEYLNKRYVWVVTQYPNFGGGYSPQFPQRPVYNPSSLFNSDNLKISVNCEDVKLMPKNWDIVSGTVMKPINSVKKGGEVKKMKRMPRIFRFALYLALVVLVWDLVLNANNIILFAVHTFILHK